MRKFVVVFSVLVIVLAISFSLDVSGVTNVSTANALSDSGIDYSESLEEVKNPDRGFLRMYYVNVSQDTKSGIDKQNLLEAISGKDNPTKGWDIVGGTKQFLICFGLEAYSSKMNGADKELTANSLLQIRNTLQTIREAGATTIVRFSYDLQGVSYSSKKDCEPPLSMILRHVTQVSPIINDFSDVITAVETGMFGPWGEQHTTTLGDANNVSGYYQLVNTWLENTNDDVYMLVRRPLYFLHWYNTKYNKNYTTKNIDTIEIIEGSLSARIGGYNDGYLGSESDWGTYTNRTQETNWLNNTKFVPFGGEVLEDSNKQITSSNKNGIGTYNCVSYIEQEAFKTHTSFLNYAFNYENVISFWEKNTYTGKDVVYKNKTSEYEYVRNHLGYRLVLRKSELSESVGKGGTLQFLGQIENVGFGNVTRKQKVYALIVDKSGAVVDSQLTSINCRTFLSSLGKVDYSQSITLPTNIAEGNYKLYLKVISEKEAENSLARTIMFANKNVYDEKLGANYIGSFVVSASSDNSSSSSKDSSKSESSSAKIDSFSSTSVTSGNSVSSKDNETNSYSSTSIESNQVGEDSQDNEKKGCASSISGQNFSLFLLSVVLFVLLMKKSKQKS